MIFHSGAEFAAIGRIAGVCKERRGVIRRAQPVGEIFICVDCRCKKRRVRRSELARCESENRPVCRKLGRIHPASVTVGVEQNRVVYTVGVFHVGIVFAGKASGGNEDAHDIESGELIHAGERMVKTDIHTQSTLSGVLRDVGDLDLQIRRIACRFLEKIHHIDRVLGAGSGQLLRPMIVCRYRLSRIPRGISGSLPAKRGKNQADFDCRARRETSGRLRMKK